MKKKFTVNLNHRELYLLWAIVCWFDKPVTSALKYRLAGMARDPRRKGLEDRYDKRIEDRIVEVAEHIVARREQEAQKGR